MPTPSWKLLLFMNDAKFKKAPKKNKNLLPKWWDLYGDLKSEKKSPKRYTKSKLRRSNSSTTKAHWTSCPGPGWERCPTWQCQASCVSTRIGGVWKPREGLRSGCRAEKKNLETPQARSRKSAFHWRNDLLNYDFRVSCWKWCLRIVSKLVYKFDNLFIWDLRPLLTKGVRTSTNPKYQGGHPRPKQPIWIWMGGNSGFLTDDCKSIPPTWKNPWN